MIVKIMESIGGPVLTVDAALVIVEDRAGNPISIACETATGYTVDTAKNQESFNRTLQTLGIDKTVICDKVVTKNAWTGAKLWTG